MTGTGGGCIPASEEAPDPAVDVGGADVGAEVSADCGALPYADRVVAFRPGDGAGHGRDDLPGVVLGPPTANRGTTTQSLDVLSLGDGGEIVVGFGGCEIHDGEGVDFVVFENPFYIGGDAANVYEELGRVSVSRDGENWRSFDCDPGAGESERWPGCAGWRPTRKFDPERVGPPEPAVTGGNGFDLADVGLERAGYVRIRDVEGKGRAPNTGFDLDAVGISHPTP